MVILRICKSITLTRLSQEKRKIYHTKTLLLQFLFVLTATASVGCGREIPEPTPTPTKTPISSANEPEVTIQETATPTAAPAALPVEANTPAVTVEKPAPTPVPANIAPYTGEQVSDIAGLRRRPIFICVNNDPVGRSAHHGLGSADMVYEYIVDGFTGTRLTALYQSQAVERVGPVRSARYPNIWMTYMYDGVLACSGGSDQIRYLLKNEVGFPYLDADIDDPSNNRYIFSIGSDYRTRMQIGTDGVRRWLSDNQLQKEWFRPGFPFSQDPPAHSAGQASVITIAYPGGNSVEWRYDSSVIGYLRFQGGQQQFDLTTGQPIIAQNVMAIVAEHELTDIVEDSLGTKSVDVKLYGFGDLRFFRDGLVYEGTWRADPENPPKWFGPGEAIITLKPGQSWVQVVRDKSEIAY